MEYSEPLGASYRLGPRIGSGAAGEVWRALDVRSNESVAAKILRAEHVADPGLVERFVRERSLLTGLRHPNIVSVRDLVVEGDRVAIVMDFIGGGSLRDVLAEQRTLRPQLAAVLVTQVLRGLAAAHQRHVVHRDIKPDNVLLLPDVMVLDGWRSSRPDGAKVTDFGIARLVTDRPRHTTGLLGTPEYMSPELISAGTAGPAGDVYGAGVLLYELLAGRTPFAGPGTDFTVAYRHVSSQVPELDLPPQLWRLLGSLLDKNPRERPSALEAAAALERLAESLSALAPLTPPPAPDRFADLARPATAVRGLHPDPDLGVGGSAGGDQAAGGAGGIGAGAVLGPKPDLGTPSQATLLRPMPQRSVATPEPSASPTTSKPTRPWWRTPWAIAAAVGAVVILIGAGVLAIRLAPGGATEQTTPPVPSLTATQTDEPRPTGLGISRSAEYDGSNAEIRLTLTYTAQKAPLRGPFFETLPGLDDVQSCPTVDWGERPQQANLPSVTGINRKCGWSVEGIDVQAQGKQQVSVSVHQPIADQGQLQDWLDRSAEATKAAMDDAEVYGTAYPAQRLQDIRVGTPSRIVSEKTLPITLIPVWPKGEDTLNPLYKSPSVGDPSAMLTAVAGGEKGVRFSDGCSGALAVSSDGLTVTTLSQAPTCTVNARVGNFTDLASGEFAIVTRGG